jgi:1,4-dihydroxy-2-naphthoyl-CoA synthase
MRRLFNFSSVIRMLDKPIIDKVHGSCVGGGNEINLCDIASASADAKFGQTGPPVGSISIRGARQLLARLVDECKARELVFTCRPYGAREALAMGVINQVVPAHELDATVNALCANILDKSPQSVRISKLALNAGGDRNFYAPFFPSAELLASIYGSEENMEGINAFLEKRKPNCRRFRSAI